MAQRKALPVQTTSKNKTSKKAASTPKITGEVKTVYLSVKDRLHDVTKQNLDLSKYKLNAYIEPIGVVFISK